MSIKLRGYIMDHVLDLWRDGWLRFEAARVNATAKVGSSATRNETIVTWTRCKRISFIFID